MTRARRRRRRRGREARSGDRRLDPPDGRPGGLRPSRAEGRRHRGCRRSTRRSRRPARPHREVVHEDNETNRAGRRAGGPQARRLRRRELHHRRLGVRPTRSRRRSRCRSPTGCCRSPRRRPAHELTGARRRRAASTAPPRRTRSRARPSPTRSPRTSAAPRARRSTSARVTTPTATASPSTFTAAWEEPRWRDRRRPRSSTTPSSRATTRRPQQITAGNPDAFVIIDFPETFVKVGLRRWSAHRQAGIRRRRRAPTVSPRSDLPETSGGDRRGHARHRAGRARRG